MEWQIYAVKEQPLEPRGDCGWGFNNPAVSPEFALQLLASLPGFSKKTSGAVGKKNEAKQVVCATRAKGSWWEVSVHQCGAQDGCCNR